LTKWTPGLGQGKVSTFLEDIDIIGLWVFVLKDGRLRLLTTEVPRANGLAFSPDKKVVRRYFDPYDHYSIRRVTE
jgi:sugar lactone lactonase YvrE